MREIPLTPSQNSSFEVDIPDTRYSLSLRYNPRIPCWHASLSLAGTVLLSGVPLVAGVELFQGHAIPNIPTNLFMIPVDESSADAGFDELGVRVKLVLVEEGDNINVTSV